jgi:chemotaxis protein CheX
MNVDYINPFIQAANLVIKAICGVNLKIGRVQMKSNTFTLCDLIIMIRVNGDIDGQIFFEMNQETAKRIAASMMGGLHIMKLDEISTSAICEMGNMIIGNASTGFYQKSIHVDMNSPTVLLGDNILIQNKIPTFVVPIKLEKLGEIKMYVNAQEALKEERIVLEKE